MPVAKVQLEDGRIARFDVPEGTTPDQVLAHAQSADWGQAFRDKSTDWKKLLNTPESKESYQTWLHQHPELYKQTAWEKYNPAYEAGGWVTDKTGSPVAGVAANALVNAIPMALQGTITKETMAPRIEASAKGWMQSALKPTIQQLKSGEADTAIGTLLEEGISPNRAGVEVLRGRVKETSKQLADALKDSNATVNIGEVGKPMTDVMNRAVKQANPISDIEAVKNVWNEFRNLHPEVGGKSDIPVQLAQELKVGTYQKLADKYGELSSTPVEAAKAIARGLKDEISKGVPEAAALNARNSALFDTLDVAERRALMEPNKNLGGLIWLTHNPQAAAGYFADKSAAFKSLLARFLYTGKEAIPAIGGAGAQAGIQSLPNMIEE